MIKTWLFLKKNYYLCTPKIFIKQLNSKNYAKR